MAAISHASAHFRELVEPAQRPAVSSCFLDSASGTAGLRGGPDGQTAGASFAAAAWLQNLLLMVFDDDACKSIVILTTNTAALDPQCWEGGEPQGMSANVAPVVLPAPMAAAQ